MAKTSGLEVADVRVSQLTLALLEHAAKTAEAADGAASDERGSSGGSGGSDAASTEPTAVRHLLTLRNGREWRMAAIQHSGGIAVWREDGEPV